MLKQSMLAALLTSAILFTACEDTVSSNSSAAQKTVDDINNSTEFKVTVINGTGSETYKAGSFVTIEAVTPLEGKNFVKWSGEGTDYLLDNTQNPATFTMPAKNIDFVPMYMDKPVVTLNDSIIGLYSKGEKVTVTAPDSKLNDTTTVVWSVEDSLNATITDESVTFTMVDEDVSISAEYVVNAKVERSTVQLTNSWGRYEGAFDVVLGEKISMSEGINPVDGSITYLPMDSSRIDFETVNSFQRASFLTTIIRSTNGTRYIPISETEYTIFNKSSLIAKADNAVLKEMNLDNSRYYLAKLGDNRGFAVVSGDVEPESTESSQTNTGVLTLEYYHFTE